MAEKVDAREYMRFHISNMQQLLDSQPPSEQDLTRRIEFVLQKVRNLDSKLNAEQTLGLLEAVKLDAKNLSKEGKNKLLSKIVERSENVDVCGALCLIYNDDSSFVSWKAFWKDVLLRVAKKAELYDVFVEYLKSMKKDQKLQYVFAKNKTELSNSERSIVDSINTILAPSERLEDMQNYVKLYNEDCQKNQDNGKILKLFEDYFSMRDQQKNDGGTIIPNWKQTRILLEAACSCADIEYGDKQTELTSRIIQESPENVVKVLKKIKSKFETMSSAQLIWTNVFEILAHKTKDVPEVFIGYSKFLAEHGVMDKNLDSDFEKLKELSDEDLKKIQRYVGKVRGVTTEPGSLRAFLSR